MHWYTVSGGFHTHEGLEALTAGGQVAQVYLRDLCADHGWLTPADYVVAGSGRRLHWAGNATFRERVQYLLTVSNSGVATRPVSGAEAEEAIRRTDELLHYDREAEGWPYKPAIPPKAWRYKGLYEKGKFVGVRFVLIP